MRDWTCLLVVTVLCCLLPACAATGNGVPRRGEVITTLTVQEEVGAARENEPIRMGIPLPEGWFDDIDELALLDANGEPIPCQFHPVARWLDDDSIRWVHTVFQASVPANESRQVQLVRRRPARTADGISAREQDGVVTVRNRMLELVFTGDNLIQSATLGGTPVITPNEGGFAATLDGKEYRQCDDSRASIEEIGSESAVVKIEGHLVNGDEKPFLYKAYVHVFANSPEVRIDLTYWKVVGEEAEDHMTMEDLSVVIPTALAGRAVTGGGGEDYRGSSVKVVARNSDLNEIIVDGEEAGTVPGKSEKPTDLGWAAVGTDTHGLAVGLRWFWQMHPTVVEADADGTLRLGLFAREVGETRDVYMGQGRTHYITLRFCSGDHWAEPLRTFFTGRQMPLRAVAPPAYYCRTTQAFGPIADADPALYPEDIRPLAAQYDRMILESAEYINGKIDGHTYQGVTRDSYGYYAWGDVYHWADTPDVEDKWNILWDSNYYDYPWAALLQFARTGELIYLDICDRHGLNLGDVFMCKWHPREELRGACRYSPPANHVGLHRNYQNPVPFVSPEFNHHKALSIHARHLLFGDFVARDHFELALNNATLNTNHNWGQCRGPGAKLWTLTEGYRLTRAPEVMDMMRRVVGAGARHRDRGGDAFGHSRAQFMYGLATEGLIRYMWITGEEDPLETIKVINNWLIDDNELRGATGNSAMSMAYLWRVTGEDRYRETAINLIGRYETRIPRPKGFGQSLRSIPYAWYYLSNLADED